MNARLDTLDQRYPLRTMASRHGVQGWREAGAGPALVLLHGIGSGSLAWAGQFEAFAATHRVLAWDAPGYASSSPLNTATPMASDYAQALADWLAALGVEAAVVVGHSLGALVAAAFAARPATPGGDPICDPIGAHLQCLVLASPAQGYGASPAAVRTAKWRERVDLIQRLGPQGLADERAARLCTPGASAAAVDLVRWNMARVTPAGYAQAAYMLAHDVLAPQALASRAPLAVFCGELDTVTTAAASAALAHALSAPFHGLPGAAHACYVEDPMQFNTALRLVLQIPEELHHD